MYPLLSKAKIWAIFRGRVSWGHPLEAPVRGHLHGVGEGGMHLFGGGVVLPSRGKHTRLLYVGYSYNAAIEI